MTETMELLTPCWPRDVVPGDVIQVGDGVYRKVTSASKMPGKRAGLVNGTDGSRYWQSFQPARYHFELDEPLPGINLTMCSVPASTKVVTRRLIDVEAAIQANTPPDDYAIVIGGRGVHSAQPDEPTAYRDHQFGYCRICGWAIKIVPGGNGPTWVHEATGTVSGSGNGPLR